MHQHHRYLSVLSLPRFRAVKVDPSGSEFVDIPNISFFLLYSLTCTKTSLILGKGFIAKILQHTSSNSLLKIKEKFKHSYLLSDLFVCGYICTAFPLVVFKYIKLLPKLGQLSELVTCISPCRSSWILPSISNDSAIFFLLLE